MEVRDRSMITYRIGPSCMSARCIEINFLVRRSSNCRAAYLTPVIIIGQMAQFLKSAWMVPDHQFSFRLMPRSLKMKVNRYLDNNSTCGMLQIWLDPISLWLKNTKCDENLFPLLLYGCRVYNNIWSRIIKPLKNIFWYLLFSHKQISHPWSMVFLHSLVGGRAVVCFVN